MSTNPRILEEERLRHQQEAMLNDSLVANFGALRTSHRPPNRAAGLKSSPPGRRTRGAQPRPDSSSEYSRLITIIVCSIGVVMYGRIHLTICERYFEEIRQLTDHSASIHSQLNQRVYELTTQLSLSTSESVKESRKLAEIMETMRRDYQQLSQNRQAENNVKAQENAEKFLSILAAIQGHRDDNRRLVQAQGEETSTYLHKITENLDEYIHRQGQLVQSFGSAIMGDRQREVRENKQNGSR